MDENLARLERIYPHSKYVAIKPYDAEKWEGREYDSSFDTKAPLNKWKSHPLMYEEAVDYVEKGYRIGWVVPQGCVIVDIDNQDDPRSQEYLERLLAKFEVKYSYNYTSKGMHILFKDPTRAIKTDARVKCGINIVIDTRANETGYIVLPTNDPHRAWGEWNDFVEDIPYFLKPLFKDTTLPFFGMKDGDGRNNALYRWRLALNSKSKLRSDEKEKCIRIINENFFDPPMTNTELCKTVLRELDNKKDEQQTKENPYNLIAEQMIGKYDIISYYDNFYMYNGTYYKPVTDLELEQVIHSEIDKNISKAGRREILEFVKVKTQVGIEEFDKDWHKIACKNGVINLVTGELELPNKTDINTIFIPYEYDSDPVYSPRIDQFMKELCGGDPLKMEFLYQIAGYCLLKKNVFEKFVICKGEGGTGKSTYTNLLHKLVGGDANCSHIGLSEFDKDYYLSTLVGKLLNVDDDVVDGRLLENTGKFKSIISGNIISVRQIYREVMDFVPYVTCIFSCNRLPKINDKTSGLYRRMILIQLNNKVAHPDPLFMNKVTDSDMQYMLFKAVQGVKLALEEGHLRITQSEQELLEIFKRRQSPLNQWLYETEITLGDVDKHQCILLYKEFQLWAQDNGYNKIMAAYNFKEDICATFDVEIDMIPDENGLTHRAFVKRGEYDPDYRPY